MIVFYELAGSDGRRFSPHCWRTRMALHHKKLPYQTVAVGFAEIAAIGDGTHKTVPVIDEIGKHRIREVDLVLLCVERHAETGVEHRKWHRARDVARWYSSFHNPWCP